MRGKDLLAIEDLARSDIELILDTAQRMTEIGTREVKKVPTLRGRTVVNLFFEPSTRTRTLEGGAARDPSDYCEMRPVSARKVFSVSKDS